MIPTLQGLLRAMTVMQLRDYYFAHRADLAAAQARGAPAAECAFSEGRMAAIYDELGRRGTLWVLKHPGPASGE